VFSSSKTKEEADKKLEKLEKLYRSGKISEDLYKELKGKYLSELKSKAPSPVKTPPKSRFSKKIIPLALVLVILAAGALYFMRSGVPKSHGVLPSLSPSPGSPTPRPPPTQPSGKAITFEEASEIISSEASKWCQNCYPIAAWLPPHPRADQFGGIALEWHAKFYCPSRGKIAWFYYTNGKVERMEMVGKSEWDWEADFTPEAFSTSLTAIEVYSIALAAGGNEFILNHPGEAVHLSMIIESKDVARWYGTLLPEEYEKVETQSIWRVGFQIPAGDEFFVFIDPTTGQVLFTRTVHH